MTTVGSSTTPVDSAALPAAIRNATPERRAEYESALSFERVLVGQMTEQLMKSSTADEDAPASVKIMKDNIPGTLADALMSAGGIGLAAQLDASWHPESAVTAPTKTSLSGGAVMPTETNETTPQAAGQGGVSA